MTNRLRLIILGCFLLLAGGIFYLVFRPSNILLYKWLDFINFDYSIFPKLTLPQIKIFTDYFPNVLYLLIAYIFVFAIWDNKRTYCIIYSSLITLLNIIYEIMTNDIGDFVVIIVIYTICLLLYLKRTEEKHEE